MLQIRDILVRIRIRLSDSAIFVSDLQDGNKNYVFYLLLLENTFTSFLKNRRNQKIFSCLMIEGSGSVPRTPGSGSGGQKKPYGSSYGSESATLVKMEKIGSQTRWQAHADKVVIEIKYGSRYYNTF